MGNYRECLPHSHIEMWILRIAFFVITFIAGFGVGITYCTLISKSNFQTGAEWMQKAYTEGKVGRVIITRDDK